MLHTIEEVQSMSDPLKAFLFTVVITELKGGVLNAENFELQTTSYTFPGEKYSKTEIEVGGLKRTDAGLKQRNGEWKTETIETWDGNVIQEFENWLGKAHDIEHGIVYPSSSYKTSAVVSQCNGEGAKIRSRKLIGLWPDATSEIEYNPTKPDPVKLKVNWQFDSWKNA